MTKSYGKILDLIDLSSSKSVVVVFATGLFVLWAMPLSILKKGRSICVFKNVIFPIIFRGHCPASGFAAGCNCPACGMSRAISAALKGKWQLAYHYNHLVFPVLGLILGILGYHLWKIVFSATKTLQKVHS